MDRRVAALLDELHAFGVAHDAGKADRLERLRNLEPATGALLALLVRTRSAPRVLELGTSNGYSTLWLADAARAAGGRVTSVELDPARVAMAQENLGRARLAPYVDLRTGDAGGVLAAAPAAAYDFVFLDAERDAYPGYWPDLVRVLAPGGLLATDNAISHAAEMAPFAELVAGDARVAHALDATGAGVLLAVRLP
jgi:predicted O-methyltransferase YrrM